MNDICEFDTDLAQYMPIEGEKAYSIFDVMDAMGIKATDKKANISTGIRCARLFRDMYGLRPYYDLKQKTFVETDNARHTRAIYPESFILEIGQIARTAYDIRAEEKRIKKSGWKIYQLKKKEAKSLVNNKTKELV